MRELNADFRGLRMRKVDYSLERRDLRVCPKPRVLGRDAALGNDRGRFHDDAPRAARRKALQRPGDVRQIAIDGWSGTDDDQYCFVRTPICTRCQSVAWPLSELYWHIGD